MVATRCLMAPMSRPSCLVTLPPESLLQWSRSKIWWCRLGTWLMVMVTSSVSLLALTPLSSGVLCCLVVEPTRLRTHPLLMTEREKTLNMVPWVTAQRQSCSECALFSLWCPL